MLAIVLQSFEYSCAEFALASGIVNKSTYDFSGMQAIRFNHMGQYLIPSNAVVDELIVNTDTGDHPVHKVM